MSNFKLCFVFDENGDYKPIPYTKLTDGEARSPEYADRYFLPLHGYLLEVSHTDYLEFYRDKRRQRYIHEESVRSGEQSWEGLSPSSSASMAMAKELRMNVEDAVVAQDEVERLHRAINALPERERQLIMMLYFEGQTVRQCADVCGVSHRTITVRKKDVLSKLEKFMRKSIQ